MVASLESWTVPDHVPPELVVEYDHIGGPEIRAFPPTSLDHFRDHQVFFSPLYGGFWVLLRHDDIRRAFQDAERFDKSAGGSVPLVPFARRQIPISLNAPEHQPWRHLLLPLFAPKQIEALEPVLRAAARHQLEMIAPRGYCEFYSEFALVLPVARYCNQLGLPHDRHDEFLKLGEELIYGTARVARTEGEAAAKAHRLAYGGRIEDLIRSLLDARHTRPGDDIISTLIGLEFEGRPLTDDEILNIVTFLFYAGTDSTSSAITFAVLHLATHPEDRIKFVENEQGRPTAIEELLRAGAVHHLTRVVRHDTEFAGVMMKEGDVVVLPTGAATRDPEAFTDPGTVDLERRPNRHLTFGAGAHRCLGVHQAHMEVLIALDEFHRWIPEYELDQSQAIEFVSAGGKSHPLAVPLIYPPSP